MRIALAIRIMMPLLTLATAFGGVDDEKGSTKPSDPPVRQLREPVAPAVLARSEGEVLPFVRQHHPELATVLEALKTKNPPAYQEAIVELQNVNLTLIDLKSRNPKRYGFALDTWKAKSRVELLAAQLAGSPSEELRSQLRLAIESKVDVEIRRQHFELEQAELAAKKARAAIDRLENNRDSIVENRFRALQPKKSLKAKKSAPAKPAPAKTPATVPANSNGEARP